MPDFNARRCVSCLVTSSLSSVFACFSMCNNNNNNINNNNSNTHECLFLFSRPYILVVVSKYIMHATDICDIAKRTSMQRNERHLKT
jgi:hypothetical protein